MTPSQPSKMALRDRRRWRSSTSTGRWSRALSRARSVPTSPRSSAAGAGRRKPSSRSMRHASLPSRWPVLRFESRGRPGLGTLARSVAVYGTMLPSMFGGIAVAALNRDAHAVTEFGVNNWINRMFALADVKLAVQGEEHLWSDRPAVFIYNHRNNFDPYVAIKLVGRDWGSVAKREIAGPLLPIMQRLTPNVAFIDRRSAE